MNSFNHYAYGAIGEWMYRVVAGLELDPARARATSTSSSSRSRAAASTSAEARLQTLYGEAASGWALADGKATVSATVPPNTHGTVRLPAATLAAVTEGGPVAGAAPGVKAPSRTGEDVVVEVGSGSYRFAYDGSALAAGSPRRRGSAPGPRSRRSSRAPRPEPRSTSAFLASPPTRGSRRPTR